jgi:hypothetical protein
LKEGAARTRYLTIEEEIRLLAAATDDVRDAIIVAIDTVCGARNSFHSPGHRSISRGG